MKATQNRVRGKDHGDERLKPNQRGRQGHPWNLVGTEELQGPAMAILGSQVLELKQTERELAKAKGC